ncbi:MAG: hypothetical protein ACREMY_14820, partial [bacterium]
MLTDATAIRTGTRSRAVGAVTGIAERYGLLIVVLAAYAAALLLTVNGIAPDTWLAVVAGGEVAHGLPTVDHLTVMADGARWVDQQWFGQLVFYRAYTAGGLLLVVLTGAGFAFVAVVAAAASALRRGADMRASVWVAAAALIPYVLPAEVPRTQSLAYPLFVAVVWLLLADNARPSRGVLLTLPLLAVWANVHGSVLIAVAVVALHGLATLRRRRAVGGALVVGSLLSVFASPYATGLPHYYRSTIFNPSFKVLSEWAPTTLTLETLPLFALLLGAAYLYGRASRLFTSTEVIVLVVTAGAALHAVRFTVWFALSALMILPRPLTYVLGSQLPPLRLNRLCGQLGITALFGLLVLTTVRGVAGYPSSASAAVATAAGDTVDVFASSRYGDWLLVAEPSLRGRVAYDSRVELL